MAGVVLDVQTTILAYVNNHYDSSIFNGDAEYVLARIYLAIHRGWGSLGGASGAAGAVTAESGGGLSVSYAAPAGWELNDLTSSQAGRAALSLSGTSLARAWVALGDVQTSCPDDGFGQW
jgi:hypothetical protein